jgi:sarcosine oxidase
MPEFQIFDYIVVGCGGIGSATLYWLARTDPNAKILGIEQFELGHHNGGSQDYSRIIRRCYHETKFAKFAQDTYSAWKFAEDESGIKLVHKTGGLFMSDKSDSVSSNVTRMYVDAMKAVNVKCDLMSAKDINSKWPQFNFGDNVFGVFDSEAGLVDAAMANSVHQQLAEARGVKIITQTKVVKLEKISAGMKVHTSVGTYQCRKVIVTAGAWLNQVLSSTNVQIPVGVTQEQVTYLATPHLKSFTKENFPIFIYLDKEKEFYGMPIHGIAAFKIGIDAGGPLVTGDTRNFKPDPVREKKCVDFLKENVPKSTGRITLTKTCLYTMTYDRTFVIDTLSSKGYPDVIVCCGAGHAYKFAALMGKILSEMSIKGSTKHDISMFSMNRPAITDKNFKPQFTVYDSSVRDIGQSKL